MPACSCLAGHRGPACNDPSEAASDYQVRYHSGTCDTTVTCHVSSRVITCVPPQLLIASLLLTTSNLAMLPAIMLAAYRGHYAECIVFTAHLIASCLHHACAEVRIMLLQATIIRNYFVKTQTSVPSFGPPDLSIIFSNGMYLEVSPL